MLMASPSRRAPKSSAPTLLLVPCVGFGPNGTRLGYGGGFYDRTLAALQPRPFTVGVGYSHGFVPWLDPEPHDVPLDVMLTDEGAAYEREYSPPLDSGLAALHYKPASNSGPIGWFCPPRWAIFSAPKRLPSAAQRSSGQPCCSP